MAQTATWATTFRVPNSLPSDTEESVVGTEWHQEAIGALADALREARRRHGASWGVCEQVALLGLRHENDTAYDPRPDVMVLAQPLPSGHMAAISIEEAGAPLFIAEVASSSTVRNDVGDKRQAYAAIGVSEYIVFDPDGSLLPSPLSAWRLESGGYVPWRPRPDGWWQSQSLGVLLQPAPPFLSVRDGTGRPIALSREVREYAERLEQRLDDEVRRRIELEEQLRRLHTPTMDDTANADPH